MKNLAEQGKAPRKGKTKPFLIGKELKNKRLTPCRGAAGKRITPKTRIKTPG